MCSITTSSFAVTNLDFDNSFLNLLVQNILQINNNTNNIDNSGTNDIAELAAPHMQRVYNEATERWQRLESSERRERERAFLQLRLNYQSHMNTTRFIPGALAQVSSQEFASQENTPPLSALNRLQGLFNAFDNHEFYLSQLSLITSSSTQAQNAGPLTGLLFIELMRNVEAFRNGDVPLYHVGFCSGNIGHEVLFIGALSFTDRIINFDNLPEDIVVLNTLHNERYIGRENVRNYLTDLMRMPSVVLGHNQVPNEFREIEIIRGIREHYLRDLEERGTRLRHLRLFLAEKVVALKNEEINDFVNRLLESYMTNLPQSEQTQEKRNQVRGLLEESMEELINQAKKIIEEIGNIENGQENNNK